MMTHMRGNLGAIRWRLIVPVAIVLFWLVMTGILVRREVLAPQATPGSALAGEFDSWMAISIDGADGVDRRVGFVHTESTRQPRGDVLGTQLAMTVKLAVTMLSAPTEIVITGNTWTPEGGGLAEFDFKVRSFDHTMSVGGTVTDGVLELEVETGGEIYPVSFPVGDDLLVSGSLGSTTLNVPELKVGEEVLIDAFDPMTLSKGKARIKCIGEDTLTINDERVETKVFLATLAGATTKVWLTDAEETVRVETPYGFVIQKTSQEEALAELDQTGTEELLNAVAIRPTGKELHRDVKKVEIQLSGMSAETEPPSDEMQRRVGPGRYVIERVEYDPEKRDASAAAEYLEGDPFVQVDHPDIAALAAELTADAATPWDKAQRIFEWVYENIEKIIVLSFPSAIDVLQSREGDCNEHTVLYTVLARSAGVPTRIAAGVVWSEALQGFYYHAWPEVHVGHWVAMDPTLGQRVADATHFKLLTGNIEKWPQLVPYLGQMKIEVVHAE